MWEPVRHSHSIPRPWLMESPSRASFSGGVRACIGWRFAFVVACLLFGSVLTLDVSDNPSQRHRDAHVLSHTRQAIRIRPTRWRSEDQEMEAGFSHPCSGGRRTRGATVATKSHSIKRQMILQGSMWIHQCKIAPVCESVHPPSQVATPLIASQGADHACCNIPFFTFRCFPGIDVCSCQILTEPVAVQMIEPEGVIATRSL